MHVWQRRASSSHSKLPWSKIKELAADDNNKNVVLTDRAENLLCISCIFLVEALNLRSPRRARKVSVS